MGTVITKLHVDKLVLKTQSELLSMPDGIWDLTFYNGDTLITTKRRTIFSHMYWDLHRRFPGSLVRKSHHVGNQPMKKGLDREIASAVFWDVHTDISNIQGADKYALVWDMAKAIYEVQNTVYNYHVTDLGAYMTTVDLGDIVGVMDHPLVVKVRDQAVSGEIDMNDAYKTIIDVMVGDDQQLRNNAICKMARAGLMNLNQIVQLVGLRGRVYATNGRIYDNVIEVGFGHGLSTLADHATESRSASLALYMTDDALKQTEYFNRQMQLHCEVIRSVEHDDCGSTHYLEWLVGDHEVSQLAGKFHMTKNGLREIQLTDKHLIGTTIRLRSIVHCENDDPTTVCRTCLGTISLVMPPNINIGHFLTIYPLAKLSQEVMSTKHVVTSQDSLTLDMSGANTKWFKLHSKNKSEVCMKSKTTSNSYIIRVNASEVSGRNTVKHFAGDPRNLVCTRMSNIWSLRIAHTTHDGKPKGDWYELDTSLGGDGSALSPDVLEVIHRNGWVSNGDYMDIYLESFKGKVLFITPRRNVSVLDYVKTIRHFIFASESKKGFNGGDIITNHNTVGSALAALKGMFDIRMPDAAFVNIEVFIRAGMTVNGLRDVNVPRGGPFIPIDARQLIRHRSVSAGLAFEGQRASLLSPQAVLNRSRQPHPLDDITG